MSEERNIGSMLLESYVADLELALENQRTTSAENYEECIELQKKVAKLETKLNKIILLARARRCCKMDEIIEIIEAENE